MTTKFTPGPWGCESSQKNLIDITTETLEIAELWSEDRECKLGPQEWADAHLIAAAPDLYAALESAVEGCGCTLRQRDSGHLVDCFAPAAIEALRKARGES